MSEDYCLAPELCVLPDQSAGAAEIPLGGGEITSSIMSALILSLVSKMIQCPTTFKYFYSYHSYTITHQSEGRRGLLAMLLLTWTGRLEEMLGKVFPSAVTHLSICPGYRARGTFGLMQ